MRILYDGLIFSSRHTGGIRRYFANLISRLPDSLEPWVTTTHPPDLHFPRHPKLQVRHFSPLRPQKLSAIAERLYFRGVERRTSFDLAHPTYYNLLSRRRLRDYRCPAIINVHDMISELFPLRTRAGDRATAIKRWAVADAQRVICISHHTKRDLIERFGVDENKIRVVYLATELSAALAAVDAPVPDRPYFLYVGGREAEYKNFQRLLCGFARVAARYAETLLCVVGAPLTGVERELCESRSIADRVVNYDRVQDGHLAKLYYQSVALVYPSLYEGFGIPPLEAMACETAVIASNRSSIPEVVGDAALLVDPESEEELSAAMMSLLEDRSRREEYIRRGRERQKLFSWDKMAGEIYEIYREVAGR